MCVFTTSTRSLQSQIVNNIDLKATGSFDLLLFCFVFLVSPWRKLLLLSFFNFIILFNRKAIRSVFRSRTTSGRFKFPTIDSLLQLFLMLGENVFDFVIKTLLFLEVLLVQLSQIFSTTRIGLVGQTHLNFLSLLLQSQRVYDLNWRLAFNRLLLFFLGLLPVFLVNFRLFFGRYLKRFLLLRHRRFIESFDHIAFHHQRSDFILKIRFSNIHQRVHLFDTPLSLTKKYHVEFEQMSNCLTTKVIVHLNSYFPLQQLPSIGRIAEDTHTELSRFYSWLFPELAINKCYQLNHSIINSCIP